MFSKNLVVSVLVASASAHMIITNPVPFGKDTLNTSPLAPADFPCKQRNGVYAISTMNQWNAGETQVVSFQGTATHGGGSCQFSITTDAEPTEKSQWKVIQSVVGNCPTDAKGNLDGADANKKPGTFPVTMPADIPEGRYTFAWTWINKVGNREFYMNCAPIQVGGGTSSASTASAGSALAALPDMFVANLPDTECSTAENEDFVYPSPGQSVVTGQSVTLGSTLSGSGCTRQNAMGAGAGEIGSPSAGTPSTPSQGTPSTPSQGTPSTPSQGTPSSPSQAVPSSPSNVLPPPAGSPISQAPTESKSPSTPGGVFAPGASLPQWLLSLSPSPPYPPRALPLRLPTPPLLPPSYPTTPHPPMASALPALKTVPLCVWMPTILVSATAGAPFLKPWLPACLAQMA